MKSKIINVFTIASCIAFAIISACNNNPKPKPAATTQQPEAYKQVSPTFNEDSAFYFVEKQVSFGPRVVETPEHKKCGDWLLTEFKKYADNVIEQKGSSTTWDKKKIGIRNVIAQFNPSATKRILITAHWDSRPIADNDPNEVNHTKSILGADDGGSGVGVMLEMARVLKSNKTDIGVDFICLDAEDLGNPDSKFKDSYCLGTQYWATHLHTPNYKAEFAINLDMVGGKGAKFVWEKNSITYAESTLRKVWEKGVQLGYSDIFYYYQIGEITDDHLYINTLAHIPAIDIIHFNEETGFPTWWHTVNDNMTNIDRKTLKAVGQSLLEVIYTEK